jgi:hypothetical protein
MLTITFSPSSQFLCRLHLSSLSASGKPPGNRLAEAPGRPGKKNPFGQERASEARRRKPGAARTTGGFSKPYLDRDAPFLQKGFQLGKRHAEAGLPVRIRQSLPLHLPSVDEDFSKFFPHLNDKQKLPVFP